MKYIRRTIFVSEKKKDFRVCKIGGRGRIAIAINGSQESDDI